MEFRRLLLTLPAGLLVVSAIFHGSNEETPRAAAAEKDHIRALQTEAIENDRSPAAHWGTDPEKYTQWGTHSNRLIPIYTFGTKHAGQGVDLDDYTGAHSPYRDEEAVRRIYGMVPENTVDPHATYCDQTDLGEIQRLAIEQGKKHVVLIVFDGMDWQTTRAAAIHRTQRIGYQEGRGHGLHFQDYEADGTSQFGWMVTSPRNAGTSTDVNSQTIRKRARKTTGGYDADPGGAAPWADSNLSYLIGQGEGVVHTLPDSAGTATAMATGVKTYNGAIGVDTSANHLTSAAHRAQRAGKAVGLVTSVPISHATPGGMYAHNVSRDDYQDISRDLLGRPSISHPERPLSGVDVLIGTGWGTDRTADASQGENFVPGNRYLTAEDRRAIDIRNGGKYLVAIRDSDVAGGARLQSVAERAARDGVRLFGFYGTAKYGHLPFRTADGDFRPAPGRRNSAETYTSADLSENPTLAEMTRAALTVLERNPKGFWLLVEAGDVDWANHDDNLDNSIGAVESGDQAVRVVIDWVERHSNWDESLVIITADHGHLLVLPRPELLVAP